MVTQTVAIKIDPDSELARALDEWGSSVVLEHGGVRYRVRRDHALDDIDEKADDSTSEPIPPNSILRIIGLGSSAEPSDIARFKDQYIADAAMHRAE